MPFITPWALALAALAAPIIALYFLKLRREERTVASTYLWRTLVRDAAANAPWQRLRPSVLLILQLLALALLVLALARPFTWTEAAAGDHLILIVDTSASMAATDVSPSRLGAAIGDARRLVAGLPPATRVTLIAAGGRGQDGPATAGGDQAAAVLVSGAGDRSLVYGALDQLAAGAGLASQGMRAGGGSDLTDAFNLAAAIAARERDPETVLLSDGNVILPAAETLPGRARFMPEGSGSTAHPPDNQAILAFSLRLAGGGRTTNAFLQVENFGTQSAQRRVVLTAAGQSGNPAAAILAARTLDLPPGRPVPLTFEDLPAGLAAAEARLEGRDDLSPDDVAWAVAPATAGATRVDLVGPGNRFLETALALLPGLKVTAIQAADYRPAACPPAAADCAPADLTILDGVAPAGPLPSGALLFVGPVTTTQFFSVTGKLAAPVAAPARADEPLLRYVDVRGLNIQQAARVPLPAWARSVLVAGNPAVPGSDQGTIASCAPGAPARDPSAPCPLLFAGETGGRRLAVLTFDLRQSDLPLRVAFPVLLANALDYLQAGSVRAGGLPDSVRPGQPVTLLAPTGTATLLISKPDGATTRLNAAAGRAVFGETEELGVYQVSRGAPTGGQAGTGDAAAEIAGRFAVNLFDARESSLEVKHTLPLAGAVGAGARPDQRQGRQEWWRLLAWLALAALAAEWLYAYRGQVAQLWARRARAGREP